VTHTLRQLRELVDQHFNDEELRDLCFDLGVDYDNLGGRGTAANGRELIDLLQRQQRLPDLIALARQQRPNVTWPDPPPPPDPTIVQARQDQAQVVFTQAKRLIGPHVRNPAGRESFFSEAYYPAHEWVLDQIDFAGAAAVFLPRCWQTLHSLAPDGSLHTRLLLTIRAYYGHDEQRQIDDLIVSWQQLCMAQMAAGMETASRPTRQPMANRPGRPTIFLSYADQDASTAQRLAAALAEYGHACRLDRAPRTDNAAWLAETAAGLGNAYAVLLLVGEHTVDDRWQRIEYLGAKDRQKVIVPIRLQTTTPLPSHVAESALLLSPDEAADASFNMLLQWLPPPPPPARHNWVSEADILRPRLAELAYMDRLKLAELQHVAQYTRLSGQADIRRKASGRLQLNPVVARQEFHHLPWRRETETLVEHRRFADAVTELKAIRRAVLLGDPGAGKTTILYKLAADLIDAALADPAAPIPLMVRLGLWTNADEPFPDFLRRSVGEIGEGLDHRLADGRVALLLDGINEIPANQQADKYRAVGAFLAQQPGLPAWVSCREQDYPPERDLRLDRVKVAPLDPLRIQEFIHNYLDGELGFGIEAVDDLFWQLAGKQNERIYKKFIEELGSRLRDPDRVFWLANQLPDGLTWGWGFEGYENRNWEIWLKERTHPASLLRLATNPYMLYMLLEVYQVHKVVPANRGQLFDWFVERLFMREGLFGWNEVTETVVRREVGEVLLIRLDELAYEMQRHLVAEQYNREALTALPLYSVTGILDERQRYQAASANLLTLGDEVRFSHQLLQEYFVARAMRRRIFIDSVDGLPTLSDRLFPLQATAIWPPDRWWQPTNWEEATILLAGLYSDDCTDIILWLADAQPELAARCIVESGAHTPEESKLRLRDLWLPHLTALKRDPDAGARAAVGRALGRVTLADGTPLDNRPGVSFVIRDGLKIPHITWGEDMAAGKYEIGGDKLAYQSFDRQTVTIPHPYRLARCPITSIQFDCFVTAPDFDDERWWRNLPEQERQIRNPTFPYANSPREMVGWYQAVAFCRWLSDKLGFVVELPHEYEWEVAARYPDNRFYPWGNDFKAARANISERNSVGQTTAVGIYPHGANPNLNLYDLSGNVWEWCRNKYKQPDEEKIDSSGAWRVLRGGSFDLNSLYARAASRRRNIPDNRKHDIGFRVVVRRPPSHPDL
jgi:hypothetical protein